MKNKKGFVVLELSVFLGLLAFLGLLIFEIEITKKQFIDVSLTKNNDFIETQKNRALALIEFEKEIINSNLTEKQIKNKYTSEAYKNFNIEISYDKEKDMFITFSGESKNPIYKVYYEYNMESLENNDIIKTIKFYKV